MTTKTEPKLFRLIDANLNRLKEGIRVIEDINRYLFDEATLSSRLKQLRHLATPKNYLDFLPFRDIETDVLKKSIESENERLNLSALLIANYKRAQEAARVLEESYKLIDIKLAQRFKNIRYELYALEKENFTNAID